jgi:hypothetical protein
MASHVDPPRLGHLIERLLYGTRERIAGTIYGTIVIMAVLAAGSDSETIDAWELDVIMVGTVVVLWCAHVYSHALAEGLSSRRRLDRRTIAGVAGREISIVLSAVVPAAALLLGAVGVVSDANAVWLALGLGTLTLAIQGVRYARTAALSASATIVVVVLNLGLGLLIVGLKAAF